MFLGISLFVLIFGAKLVSSQVCGNYSLKIKPDEVYEISSPDFDGLYPPMTSCFWNVEVSPGYLVDINCDYFEIPSSPECTDDRFIISRRGRSDLSDGERYCENGQVTFQSLSIKATFSLQSVSNSPGGRLRCWVSAKRNSCKCGIQNRGRIVGENETLANEYPMMAGIIDSNLKAVYCGATIISESVAVTASHCLINKDVSVLALLVGDHDTTKGLDTPYAALYKISKYVQHHLFNSSVMPMVHDIALIWTETPMKFNRGVGAACLPYKFTRVSFENSRVIAAGWGLLDFGGKQSNVLQHVHLDVVKDPICTGFHICTYSEDKDTCQRDSGGPLFYIDENYMIHLVGIISEGFGCAVEGMPGINVRVTPYLEWIEYWVPETVFCVR